jgi:hypothetical protein
MDVAESIDVAAPPADLALAAESERKDDEKTARRAAEKEWGYTISFWLETLATKTPTHPRSWGMGFDQFVYGHNRPSRVTEALAGYQRHNVFKAMMPFLKRTVSSFAAKAAKGGGVTLKSRSLELNRPGWHFKREGKGSFASKTVVPVLALEDGCDDWTQFKAHVAGLRAAFMSAGYKKKRALCGQSFKPGRKQRS